MQRPPGTPEEPAGWPVGQSAMAWAVVHAMPVPTLLVDGGGVLLDVSDSWRWLVYDAELPQLAALLPGCDLLTTFEAWMQEAPVLRTLTEHLHCSLEGGRPPPVELAIPFAGSSRWYIVASQAMPGGAAIVVTLTDITDRRAAEQQLQHQAMHDVLTGLPNRALLGERLRQRAVRSGGAEQVSVFFLDLDDFKQVNDTLGHDAGDVVLVEVARRLKTCVREQDFVARLGGDEFVVVAEGLVGDVEALAYADRLAECVAVDIAVLGHVVSTSASIGVASTSEASTGHDMPESETASLIRHADIAMLQAKASGRGQVGFDRALDSARRRRSDQVLALRHALQNRDLHAQFQPVVRLADSQVVAAEALARWTQSDGRTVAPAEFIPLAERNGMITPIDRAMMLAAAQALVSGALGGEHLRCSVNSSPMQVPTGMLLGDVESALEATGLAPERLTVEVTETAVLGDPATALEQLKRVKAAGVGISLDDFGTGFSSLTHLTTFPIDVLKVDQSFVSRMLTDVRALEVVRAVVRLGRALDMDVVAEGIETEQQRDALRDMGCPLGQGWFYGAAVPACDFPALAATVSAAD